MRSKLAIGILALACAAANTVAVADDWQYTLRPGDELWSIARDFCGSARDAERIAAYNNLTNVGRLRAGTRIKIPTDWLVFAPTSAVFSALNGEVKVVHGGATDAPTSQPKVGTIINMGDTIVTTEGSALVTFADGSTLSIQPESRILFNKLTAFGPAGMVDTHLRFTYGKGTSTVKPQNRGDRFRIETPQGIAAVRGTEFRVGYSVDGTAGVANTETLEGAVVFTTRQQPVDLPAGFGVAASAGGVTKESLLEAPMFTQPAEALNSSDYIRWRSLAKARQYTVTWATQAQPSVTLRQQVVTETQARIDLAPGTYLARVRGVSAAGIEGLDASLPITVMATAPQPEAHPATAAQGLTVGWRDADKAGSYTVVVTNRDTQEREVYQTRSSSYRLDLPVGQYQWQVQSDTSSLSAAADFTILPATPTALQLRSDKRTLAIAWDKVEGAQSYKLVLQAKDRDLADIELVTDKVQAIVEVPQFGSYRVILVAQQNSLQSVPVESDIRVIRRPWWLLLIATVILAL